MKRSPHSPNNKTTGVIIGMIFFIKVFASLTAACKHALTIYSLKVEILLKRTLKLMLRVFINEVLKLILRT